MALCRSSSNDVGGSGVKSMDGSAVLDLFSFLIPNCRAPTRIEVPDPNTVNPISFSNMGRHTRGLPTCPWTLCRRKEGSPFVQGRPGRLQFRSTPRSRT